jgi:hypothetical protein
MQSELLHPVGWAKGAQRNPGFSVVFSRTTLAAVALTTWSYNMMVLQHGVVSAAQSPIATDICPEPADGISVTPDTCLILMNQATAGVMLPIKGKASLVLLKLPLRMLQLLLVSAQVA